MNLEQINNKIKELEALNIQTKEAKILINAHIKILKGIRINLLNDYSDFDNKTTFEEALQYFLINIAEADKSFFE